MRWDKAWFRRLDREIANLPFLPPSQQQAVRRALGRDIIAFAVLYLRHHLGETLSFSEAHFVWARQAETWQQPVDDVRQARTAVVAPRECGKSTWWFLIIPLWAAANGHAEFIAAFAHSSGQAEAHLATLKGELDNNHLLRVDYPDLCEPEKRPTGVQVADRQGMLHTKRGFVFAARGIDSAVLGLKVGHRRPDKLVLDDIEPPESNYSALLAEKRLATVINAILPLSARARTTIVGTVTMPGSIVHQLVKAGHGVDVAEWIGETGFTTEHTPPILVDDQGVERSVWPEQWSLEYLQSIRLTRSFALNFANDPMGRDGAYWQAEDIRHDDALLPGLTRRGLWVDPAVTEKQSSDMSGLAVVAYARGSGRVQVLKAVGVRLTGGRLRDRIVAELEADPLITNVIVEVNQGGELWDGVLSDVPVPVFTHVSSVPKAVRFAEALEFYQRGLVSHLGVLPQLEEQQVGFPLVRYDDVCDAVVAGVLSFLGKKKPRMRAVKRGVSYI